ncbi:MAG: OmpA family protein [Pseudomonadota bacterium]|nr:OmpA family protein [Pseudomonadota bacterium]
MRQRWQRKKARATHADDWLITYADMITLLLCFFAVFLSVSVPKKAVQVALPPVASLGRAKAGQDTVPAGAQFRDSLNHDELGDEIETLTAKAREAKADAHDEAEAANLSRQATEASDPLILSPAPRANGDPSTAGNPVPSDIANLDSSAAISPASSLSTSAATGAAPTAPTASVEAPLQSSPNMTTAPARALDQPAATLPQIVERLKSQGTAEIEQKGDRITTMEMSSGAFFGVGSAALSDSGKAILAAVAVNLKADQFKDYQVTVEGHTDDSPIKTLQFLSNWELSTARASAVVHFFLQQGVPAQKLRAAGYADTFPIAPNRDANGNALPANQAKNRRVVIKLEKIERIEP